MLNFVSNNINKYEEVKRILGAYNIDIRFRSLRLVEIQEDEIELIAKYKTDQAFDIIKDEVIVEDDGLFINVLNGFPGVYSSYIYKSIGNDGILKLMNGLDDRSTRFISIIGYSNGLTRLFKGIVNGTISYNKRGNGWGFDPIFIPQGYELTYGEITNKDEVSHRAIALRKFVRWYLEQSVFDNDFL